MQTTMAPLTANSSLSSDYYDDDPEFLQALNDADLDGMLPPEQSDADESIELEMPPPNQACLKRPRSPVSDEDDGSEPHGVLSSVDPSSYLASHTYGASRFGEFGEYMSRKRAKLQIQNAQIDAGEEKWRASSRIFSGLQIYINGWTEPSVQHLRQLIVQHGGIFHAYLDKKSLVTHIITCSLTPAKIREFKHMKVVRPEWLVESARAGNLLPWHDFTFRPGERTEESQGRMTAQKSLFDGFVSQDPQRYAEDNHVDDAPLPADPGPSAPPRTPRKPNISSPSRPLYTTDPASPSRVPEYAAHTSNLAAERAMADPAWRAAHTSVAPDFIEGYYRHSRLHHLSTWKAELKNLVAEAQERVERGGAAAWGVPSGGETAVGKIAQENLDGTGLGAGEVSMRGAQLPAIQSPKGKGQGRERARDAEAERVIMHCDFDSFFVSAGLIGRPHLRGKPVVVCHSQGVTGGGASTSEIASASYEARKFGIKGGMSLQQARKLCPTVLTIPYEFQRYKQFSLQFYTILMAHADDLQAVSVDEALIDVTSSVGRIRTEIARSQDPNSSPSDPAQEFAEAIRAQVKKVTGCEVSIGIAHNIMLARVASRRAKPAGSFHIHPTDVADILAPLDIDDLHGFGYSARQKAREKLGATNLGELATKSKALLCDALGKGTGETLYKAVRGIEDRKLESDKPRKSVSCDINYGIRFENSAQAETFVYQMAEELAKRLNDIDMRGQSLTLKVMKRDPSAPVEAPKFLGHGICETFNKQTPLITPGGRATSDDRIIGEHAWRLLKGFNFDPKELRGIGIQIQKLEKGPTSSMNEPAQAVLPFKPLDSAKDVPHPADPAPIGNKRANEPQIVVEPPSQSDDEIQIISPPKRKAVESSVDLPSFSQVDMSVFEALPEDVRTELEMEYKRRSVTPAVAGDPPRDRSISAPVQRQPKKIFVKGVKGINVRRITKQLAPRSRSSISPKKSVLFAKRAGPFAVNVSDKELRKLDIDPGVFTMLPADLQREQLAMARQVKYPGAQVYTTRKVLKPSSRISRSMYRLPAPKAKFVAPPTLKQQGQAKGEKLYFTETDDVQQVVEAWVSGFTERPPNQKDVEYFAKFLVQCVDNSRSTDTGIEKAVAVAKWWLVLLRRHFGVWEHAPDMDGMQTGVTSESIGRAWWRAFREVKAKMDIVARKKFGGCLSLR